MTFHRIVNKRNMTGATSGTITTYHFRSLEYRKGTHDTMIKSREGIKDKQ
jgi:hypothetical protein